MNGNIEIGHKFEAGKVYKNDRYHFGTLLNTDYFLVVRKNEDSQRMTIIRCNKEGRPYEHAKKMTRKYDWKLVNYYSPIEQRFIPENRTEYVRLEKDYHLLEAVEVA